MNQAGFYESLKQMRFKEAYDGYQCIRLTPSEVAVLLGVCDPSSRRYMCRYEESDMDAVRSTVQRTFTLACTG